MYGLRKVVQSRSLSAARRHAVPAPGDKIKILIVDDDDPLRTRLAKHLEPRGVDVQQAQSGDEAFYLLPAPGAILLCADRISPCHPPPKIRSMGPAS